MSAEKRSELPGGGIEARAALIEAQRQIEQLVGDVRAIAQDYTDAEARLVEMTRQLKHYADPVCFVCQVQTRFGDKHAVSCWLGKIIGDCK